MPVVGDSSLRVVQGLLYFLLFHRLSFQLNRIFHRAKILIQFITLLSWIMILVSSLKTLYLALDPKGFRLFFSKSL